MLTRNYFTELKKEKMVMMTNDHQYLLGGVIASLLGFVLLYGSRLRREKSRASTVFRRSESFKTTANGSFGPTASSGGADVVIVGAGVAGAALAYTLGKVIVSLIFSLYLLTSLSLYAYVHLDTISLNKLSEAVIGLS